MQFVLETLVFVNISVVAVVVAVAFAVGSGVCVNIGVRFI